ncbi:hypothetical protein [uncultured Mesonia sp.]|uniref:hypothetical protein n=1 Tax=uncultured Mesonia sp. TaxID=399731 RepID=UPI00374E7EC2
MGIYVEDGYIFKLVFDKNRGELLSGEPIYKNFGNGNSQWNHDLFNVFDLRQSIENNLIMIDSWLDPNDSFSNIINNDGVFQNKQQFYF